MKFDPDSSSPVEPQHADDVAVPRGLLRLAVEAMNRCSCPHAVRDASESVDEALEVFERLLGLPFGWLPEVGSKLGDEP